MVRPIRRWEALLAEGIGRRRYQQIARALVEDIVSGRHAAGDRLPPERELAIRFEVSRATVREAMLALELTGHVEIRIGSGVFVLPPNPQGEKASLFQPPQIDGPWDVLDARRLIEGETAARAAARADASVLDAIGAAIEDMARAVNDTARFDKADTAFHALIAEAAGSALYETYVEQLWQMRQGPMWDRWYARTRSVANRRQSIAEHRVIHRALCRRLPTTARTAMESHIDTLTERFLALRLDADEDESTPA